MPFQPAPNGIEVVFNAIQNNVPVVNVYHVAAPAAVTLQDLQDVTVVFHTWWVNGLRLSQHTSYVLSTIVARDISVENGQEVTFAVTGTNAGTATGAAAAANASAVISWRTAFTGRSFRGRTYIGGLPNLALADAQTLSTGEAQTYAVQAAGLIDALEAAGFILSVLSRVANGVQRVTGLLTQIIEVIVDTKVDSQRRRTAN